MTRRRQIGIQVTPRIPASTPGHTNSGMGSTPSATKPGWRMMTGPMMGADLNASALVSQRIYVTRLTCATGTTVRGVSRLDHFLTTNGVAPVTGTFVAVWDATSRALLGSTAVGGMDAAWSLHTNTWQTATLNNPIDISNDVYVGSYAVSASPPGMVAYGGVSVPEFYATVAGVTVEITGYVTGPFAAVPNPLPALTVSTSKPYFWGLR